MNWHQLLAVSIWEFRRFCKLKDILITLVFWVVAGLAYTGVTAIVAWNTTKDLPRIAVLGGNLLTIDASTIVTMEPADDRNEATLRALVDDGDLDGVLILHAADRGSLYVSGDRLWQDQLQAALDDAARDARMADANIDPAELERITAPFEMDRVLARGQTGESGTWAKATGGVFLGLMVLGILIGNSYLFIGITGEKQNRVTEQIIAAVPPQTWIDGKILGLSLMVFVMMVNTCVGGLVANLVLTAFGAGVDLSSIPVHPVLVVQLMVMGLLGFFFWFVFFAAVAATIDDPNTSSRSGFIMLPLIPMAVAGFTFINADTTLMRVLSILPPTAPAVLSARLILTDVAAWEFFVATALLVGSVLLMRRAAGKIFAMGILMHGTEPSWRDIVRWMRQA